jgi:KDO2-lipid IV(A) lauroyltransferase
VNPKHLLPRYWPTWLGLALLRGLALLPFSWLVPIGRALGRALRVLPLTQVAIARRNIELCLPERSAEERERILREHFESLGVAVCETALAWYASDARIRSLSRIDGLGHLEAALERGKGAIAIGTHFTTTEVGARILAIAMPTNVVYRPAKNAVLGAFLARNRALHTRRAIPRDDIRTMVGALKANELVWFAPDQAYRKKGAAMVPFFGIPAATNPATSRLARLTGAAVLPYFVVRLPGSAGYRATLQPALENFPSDDAAQDALRLHGLIEERVREAPAQYLWIHRRFKGLTPDYPDYYGKRG